MPLFRAAGATSITTDDDGYLLVPGQPPTMVITEDLGSGALRITRLVKNATGEQIVESVIETPATS